MSEDFQEQSDYSSGHFQEEFKKFKQGYLPLKTEATEAASFRQLNEAPDFNIFTILDANSEIKYSTFIAELLNPKGKHGQGFLFLQSFLEMCRDIHPAIPIPDQFIAEDTWEVRTEFGIPQGRLDILIRSRERGYFYIIENKVKAREGEDQLEKYIEWMDRLPRDIYKYRTLIFLTPTGRHSETAACKLYFPISYRDNILSWLHTCIEDQNGIKASPVGEVAAQFLKLDAFKQIEKAMMDYEKEIDLYILKPENLEVALNVSKRISKLKKDLHRKFWDDISNELNKRLQNSAAAGSWYLRRSEKRWDEPWHHCTIQPIGYKKEKKPLAIGVTFKQNEKEFRLYFGIRNLDDDLKEVWSPSMEELSDQLVSYGLVRYKHYLGRDMTEYRARTGPFMRKMYSERESFINEMADLVWNPYIENLSLIEECNTQLSAMVYGG